MCVAHNHIEHTRHHGVAARIRHPEAERLAPRPILLNPRDASDRRGRHRGDYLGVVPTENLTGGATQPDSTAALRGPEAGAGERDGSSGVSHRRAYGRELKRVHSKWYRRAHDAI